MIKRLHIIKVAVLFLIIALCCISCATQDKTTDSNNALPVSTPEAEGVSSEGIMRFLDAVDAGNNEVHSLVILRHGKVITEAWWNPYARDLKHVMFSVSKSFTSMGVGIAIGENKLKLDDKVISFFPESLPDSMSTYMQEMTVEDLLKMSTGMNADPLFTSRGSTNWPKAFISSPVENQPGTVCKYNNMASFMLSAIVQKATGEKLADYLKPRLFAPLGITNFSWDETPEGYTFGAIGLKLQSGDMAKFGQMLLQKGKWNGQQIIPASWIEEATSFQIESQDPSNTRPKELNDWAQGYGYQFWRGRNNSYRADGLGGQFIIVLPEKDAVVVLTSSATDTQEEMNLVWEYLLPAMKDGSLPVDEAAAAALDERIASLATLHSSSADASDMMASISGKKIELATNETGVNNVSISMKGDEAVVQISREEGQYEITAGPDRWVYSNTQLNSLSSAPRPSSPNPKVVASKYSWRDENTLELSSKWVEESIRSEAWILRFEPNDKQINVTIEVMIHVEFAGIQSRILEGKILN